MPCVYRVPSDYLIVTSLHTSQSKGWLRQYSFRGSILNQAALQVVRLARGYKGTKSTNPHGHTNLSFFNDIGEPRRRCPIHMVNSANRPPFPKAILFSTTVSQGLENIKTPYDPRYSSGRLNKRGVVCLCEGTRGICQTCNRSLEEEHTHKNKDFTCQVISLFL